MKVLITGATGFVGRALCLRLARDGHEVVAWVRDAHRARQQLGSEPELVQASPRRGSLEQVVERVDAVVNLAGESIASRWTTRRRQVLRDSRVGVTGRLVGAIEAAGRRPAVLVSCSAVGYYGDRGDERLTEAATAGGGFLAALSRDWEDAALRAERSGTRVVLLRLGIVLAAEGGVLDRLLPLFRRGLGGRMGHGRQVLPWIHLEDVVEVIVRALSDRRLHGPVNVTAPEPPTNRQFTAALARALHRPAWLRVPSLILRLALGEAATTVLAGQHTVPTKLQQIGFSFNYRDLDRALAEVTSTPATTITGVRRADLELPRSGYLQRRPPRYLLRQSLLVDAPLAEVFDFFSRAENLGAITPPRMAFRMLCPPAEIAAGTTIDYRIKVGPLPLSWRTVIERWQPNESFVDAQHRGPYHCWWHEHRFHARGAQTLMEDRVWYSPPLGPLGRVAQRLLVAPMLRQIFGYRARAIRLRFGLGQPPAALAAA